MFGEPGNPLRPMGVKIAEAGERGQGKPQTLIQVLPTRMFIAQFYDEHGREEAITLVEMSGEFYAAPNSVEWTKRLRPISRWLREQLKCKLADNRPVNVPTDDTVDVMDDEEEEKNPIAERIAKEAEERAGDVRG
jgi:hypothetical protein